MDRINSMLLVFLLIRYVPGFGQEAISKKFDSSGRQVELVWHDEFDYSGLPDESKWDYEVGMIRGTELQYYTRKRILNAHVSNGQLTIRALKEKFANPDLQKYRFETFPTKYAKTAEDSIPAWVKNRFDSTFNYTSASLVTLHKASWLYGRIEVRAKLPRGKGIWPIIWMMGSSIDSVPWPYCGEVDFMEHVGRIPNVIQANVHYALERQKKVSSEKKIEVADPTNKYYVYTLEWSGAGMKFFIDDRMFHSFSFDTFSSSQQNPFAKPMYLLLSLAVGGSFGGPVDNEIFPQEFNIDYVRIYQ